MKKIKIVVIISGIITLLFGLTSKGKTEFQKYLGKSVKINSTKYLLASVCGGDIGGGGPGPTTSTSKRG
jgi:hypothetical protein